MVFSTNEHKPNPHTRAAVLKRDNGVIYLRNEVFKLRTLPDRTISNFVWFAHFEREFNSEQTEDGEAWNLMVINEAKRRGLDIYNAY